MTTVVGPKINKVFKYQTPMDGEVYVCKGKLQLVHIKKYMPEIGMLGSNNVHQLFMWTQQHKNSFKELVEYHNTLAVLPVIISDSDVEEELNTGDYYYDHLSSEEPIKKFTFGDGCPSWAKKVLVQSHQFSHLQLQEMIDFKVRNKDTLYVMCVRKGNVNNVALSFYQHSKYFIPKTEETIDEALQKYMDIDLNKRPQLQEFLKKNYTALKIKV